MKIKLEYSKKTLLHYIQTLFEENNLNFNSDCIVEIECIIEEIEDEINKINYRLEKIEEYLKDEN